jgi:hypothetical protein
MNSFEGDRSNIFFKIAYMMPKKGYRFLKLVNRQSVNLTSGANLGEDESNSIPVILGAAIALWIKGVGFTT